MPTTSKIHVDLYLRGQPNPIKSYWTGESPQQVVEEIKLREKNTGDKYLLWITDEAGKKPTHALCPAGNVLNQFDHQSCGAFIESQKDQHKFWKFLTKINFHKCPCCEKHWHIRPLDGKCMNCGAIIQKGQIIIEDSEEGPQLLSLDGELSIQCISPKNHQKKQKSPNPGVCVQCGRYMAEYDIYYDKHGKPVCASCHTKEKILSETPNSATDSKFSVGEKLILLWFGIAIIFTLIMTFSRIQAMWGSG